MATRRKKPWNADLKMPGLLGEPPSPPPAPMPETPVPAGTSSLMGDMRGEPAPVKVEPVTYECLRCERLLDGLEPLVPGHALRCPYRGTGRDPEPRG
jgi:hypothetical protein